jgi:ribosomal protein S17
VNRKVEHPKLLKLIPRSTKFLVHDEEEGALLETDGRHG